MEDLKLLAIDVETTMNGNVDVGLAHPMHPDNHIVLLGTYDGSLVTIGNATDLQNEDGIKAINRFVKEADFIVGHNISFDLKYLYKDCPDLKENLQKARLWDTQLAEYLLTGQKTKWASLDELCVKYGLPVKESLVQEYFKRGEGADKIPRKLLSDYLKGDVESTYAIAVKQLHEAVDRGMLPLIISQMEALHATTEMTFNGMRIYTPYILDYQYELQTKKDAFTTLVKTLVPIDVDIESPKQLSRFLFGGLLKETVKEQVGIYKNGKPKYKNKIILKNVEGICTDIPIKEEWKNKLGVSVGDEVLTALAKSRNPQVTGVATSVLKIRELNKSISTYCEGLLKHSMDGFIYGNINHVATGTGRLSSTAPNLQNISNDPIKKAFKSRYEDGSLVEVDFNQLEVVALAHLSGDEQLIKDITSGDDIHSELYKTMHGHYPSKEDRKWFKRLTFGLIYGAGYKTLAKNAGCADDTAKLFISVFYERYPGVAYYHKSILELADKEAKLTIDGAGKRHYTHVAETKRNYVFTEYTNEEEWKVKKSGRLYSFSPTELKNYPVQGLATGDIVPLMLGILYRQLVVSNKYGDKIKFINTIHDSVMFDAHPDVVDLLIEDIRTILNQTHKYYEATFGIPLKLNLQVECSKGSNWFEMDVV